MTWYNKNDVVIFFIPSLHYLFKMTWYNKKKMSILKQIENQAFVFLINPRSVLPSLSNL